MSERAEPRGDAPEQGLDEDVVVTGDAGTVSGLGPQEALDEAEDDVERSDG